MTAQLDYSEDDLQVREIPVRMGDKRFILREASEDTAARFNDLRLEGAEMGPGGALVRLPKIGRLQSFLVSYCLWELDDNGNPFKAVAESKVKSWPGRIVKQLFEKAKEISGLDEGESAERKALKSALAREDAPVTLQSLQEWLGKIKDEDPQYRLLYALVEPDKDAAKNSRSATTDTSG